MPKLEINTDRVHDIILQVAPLVSQATSWNLGLSTLKSRLLPKDLGYEEILLGRLHHIGIDDWQSATPDLFERLVEYLIEENAMAAYQPGSGEILVIRENVDDSNLDGLKLILGHELVHRGQHIHHASLFNQVDDLLRRLFQEMKSDTANIRGLQYIFQKIQPIMTLLESHAAYIQQSLKQTYFPNAQVETHFNIATLLMRLFGKPKLAQYCEGLPQVAAAAKSGNIEKLYTNLGG